MREWKEKKQIIVRPEHVMVYDMEVMPNCVLFGYEFVAGPNAGRRGIFEVSQWRNDLLSIVSMLDERAYDTWMVGFNNVGYDELILSSLVSSYIDDVDPLAPAYEMSEKAVAAKDMEHKFALSNKYGRESRHPSFCPKQIDLMKIWHFDNKNRSTSLKQLEFNFNRRRIQELPIAPGTIINEQQREALADYLMASDIPTTVDFWHKSEQHIELRQEFTEKYDFDFLNLNDTAIGKNFFILQLKESGVKLYDEQGKRQTRYDKLRFRDAIFRWHTFNSPEFNAMYQFLLGFESDKTKEIFKDIPTSEFGELSRYMDRSKGGYVKKEMKRLGVVYPERVESLHVVKDGMAYVMGTGGIHASVHNKSFTTEQGYVIDDRDVTSFYPSTVIINKLFPKHIGVKYAEIYAWLKKERLKYPKGTSMNKMLKLALNGTFGDSGNEFSVLFDHILMIAITLNGQLALLKLAEDLLEVPTLSMIQCNTDGLTIHYHESQTERVNAICNLWEGVTGYDLEQALYTRMWVANVNNYIAEYKKGDGLGYKLKGAYNYEWEKDEEWHKNFSNRVSIIAAVKYMTEGIPVEDTILQHEVSQDFMLRAKVNKPASIYWGGEKQQNICRYYVSKHGHAIHRGTPQKDGTVKLGALPPTRGRVVNLQNLDNTIHDWQDVDYDFYINEAKKLLVTG